MELEEEVRLVVKWYDSLPEEFKRYVAFRVERMGDPGFQEIHEVLKQAAKLSKLVKKK